MRQAILGFWRKTREPPKEGALSSTSGGEGRPRSFPRAASSAGWSLARCRGQFRCLSGPAVSIVLWCEGTFSALNERDISAGGSEL